ncbi:hypothetical protein AAFC00_001474 [Neodothiora populina]|uniref:C2H2-type domain-containing protein n=1 Tax=Neodothiora populina TaxID=2781224 RepID=A0ABR3PP73_9PEZI
MPPNQRSTTLPSAQTESARELARKFYCELCGKGYARIDQIETHENSYEHQHRKRAKEMRALTNKATAAARESASNRGGGGGDRRRRENAGMLSSNLQTSDGARPSNATGFRDVTQVKSGAGAGATVTAAMAEDVKDVDETQIMEEEVKMVMRPPDYGELSRCYSLVDVSRLPAELQQKEVTLPWASIWSNGDGLEKFLDAVDAEIDQGEDGTARERMNKAWEGMSEGSGLDVSD